MMRSDMPKQVMAYRNGGGIPSLATVPMETTMGGQPHRLAYVNPIEEEMMKQMGGLGVPGPGGIPSYLFGYTSIGDMFDGGGAGGSGANFSTGSHEDYVKNNPDDDTAKAHTSSSTSSDEGPASIGVESGSSGNTNIGVIDSILMGLGIKEATPEYYAATANTIAATQGSDAASNYISGLDSDDVPSGTFDAINSSMDTITSSGENFDKFQPTGGGGSSASAAPAADPEPDPMVLTPFNFTDSQLTAQSDYLQRISGITSQYTPEQLQSFDIRQQISSQFVPTAEEFMAITGASEDLTNQLLATPGQFDLRDWSKIMASDNPLEAAQAATSAVYLTEGLYGRGMEINPELQLANLDNLIGQTDQLFAYAAYPEGSEIAYIDGVPTDVRLGIKTADGVKLADLGSINAPDFYNVLQGYGYGAEDVSELLPSIEKYYSEQMPFGIDQAIYKPVSELDYDYQTFYTPEQVEMYNQYYAGADTDTPLPLLGEFEGQQYFLTNAPVGRPGDPFNLLGGLQSAAPNTMTKDLGLGQSFLYSSTPGYYGLADPVLLQNTNTGVDITNTGINTGAVNTGINTGAVNTAAVDNTVGQPVTNLPVNTGVQTYNALVPSAGTSSAGIVGLPSSNTTSPNPFIYTAYTPGTYNPAVNPLVLPPLG